MSGEREEARPRLSMQREQAASARVLRQGQTCVGVLEKLKETGRCAQGSKGKGWWGSQSKGVCRSR